MAPSARTSALCRRFGVEQGRPRARSSALDQRRERHAGRIAGGLECGERAAGSGATAAMRCSAAFR